jgi:FkbM family methyltransferase
MQAIRATAERLSRNVVLRRRLPSDLGGGKLFVSPGSSLSFWKRGLSSDLFDFAREFVKPGAVVWDVGANVGLFAFAASSRAGSTGSVVAVEADIWLVDLLRRSADRQNAAGAKVEVLPAAAGIKQGIADFNIARRGRSANFLASSLGSTQSGGVRRTVQVLTVSLDWLLENRPAPQVLKIDVEGAELQVLQGAQRLLREIRPVILCEVDEPTRSEVTRLFRDASYLMYDWDNRAAGEVNVAAWNTLALPK